MHYRSCTQWAGGIAPVPDSLTFTRGARDLGKEAEETDYSATIGSEFRLRTKNEVL